MKKNVAGQKVGCQMVSATDGSEFTSAVTVYVTGDAGTQAVGSVGSGACVHEGHGFHTYAPSQAETNYDIAAFTFVGTGAVPATLQFDTVAPTSVVDIQARIPAALTANGNMKASLVEILTTALTETAGLLAAGFKKFFNVATPTGTVNSLPDAVAGAAGGLAIVGSAMLLTSGTGAGQILLTSGRVSIRSALTKGVARPNFVFGMTENVSGQHNPAVGKTVTVTRSLDGGAFGAGTIANIVEISNGLYQCDFGSGDMNADIVTIRATASGCDDNDFSLVTTP